MGVIIDFFKTLFKSIGSLITWVVGLPSLIITSVWGIITSIKSMLATLYQPVSGLQSALNNGTQLVTDVKSYIDGLPDYIHTVMYTLSLDVLIHHVVSTLSLVISVTYIFLVFLVISVPVYLVGLYTLKYGAKLYSGFVPQAYVPAVVDWIANLQLPTHKVMFVMADKFLKWEKASI